MIHNQLILSSLASRDSSNSLVTGTNDPLFPLEVEVEPIPPPTLRDIAFDLHVNADSSEYITDSQLTRISSKVDRRVRPHFDFPPPLTNQASGQPSLVSISIPSLPSPSIPTPPTFISSFSTPSTPHPTNRHVTTASRNSSSKTSSVTQRYPPLNVTIHSGHGATSSFGSSTSTFTLATSNTAAATGKTTQPNPLPSPAQRPTTSYSSAQDLASPTSAQPGIMEHNKVVGTYSHWLKRSATLSSLNSGSETGDALTEEASNPTQPRFAHQQRRPVTKRRKTVFSPSLSLPNLTRSATVPSSTPSIPAPPRPASSSITRAPAKGASVTPAPPALMDLNPLANPIVNAPLHHDDWLIKISQMNLTPGGVREARARVGAFVNSSLQELSTMDDPRINYNCRSATPFPSTTPVHPIPSLPVPSSSKSYSRPITSSAIPRPKSTPALGKQSSKSAASNKPSKSKPQNAARGFFREPPLTDAEIRKLRSIIAARDALSKERMSIRNDKCGPGPDRHAKKDDKDDDRNKGKGKNNKNQQYNSNKFQNNNKSKLPTYRR